MPGTAPAADVARWKAADELWLDHAAISEADLDWMGPVRSLTLWNVRVPAAVLPRLPQLLSLELRGGSARDLDVVRGCGSLERLAVNQLRGLSDLGALSELTGLRCLELYGLPRVTVLPSLASLERLERVDLGSMKGLQSLAGVLQAPALRELQLLRSVAISDGDLEALAAHPSLGAFGWFWEGVPAGVAQPVLERMAHLPAPIALNSRLWFDGRA